MLSTKLLDMTGYNILCLVLVIQFAVFIVSLVIGGIAATIKALFF